MWGVKDLEDYQQRDLDQLRELFTAEDPRGLAQMIAEDTDYYDETLETVKSCDSGYEIGFDGGWMTFLTVDPAKVTVKPGDTVRFYGRKFGVRHGFAINGKVIEWKTPFERFAERITMLANHDRGHHKDFDESKPDIDRWYAQLHGPYKARIDRFRTKRADFDVNGGSYEIYPVLMAQRIEHWARCEAHVPEGPIAEDEAKRIIKEFQALPHDDQKPVIHAGEPDKYGISGHQFDSACGCAFAVLTGNTI